MNDIIKRLVAITRTVDSMTVQGGRNGLKLGASVEALEEIINTLIKQEQGEPTADVEKHSLAFSEQEAL